MPLWAHQLENIEEHGLDASHALWWEPRIGKTRTMIGHMRRLIEEQDVNRVLIVGPQLPLNMTWLTELAADARWEVFNLSHGPIVKRCEILKTLCPTKRKPRLLKPTVVLVNYDVLQNMRAYLCRFRPDLIIADEAHLCKNYRAHRSAALQRIGDFSRFKRMLTGTPDPKNYADYYALYRFLDKRVFGLTVTPFRERYCRMHHEYKTTVIGYNEENLDELRDKVHSLGSRQIRANCFDLPEVQLIERRIEMPPGARALYDTIVRENVVLRDDQTARIDGSHKLTKLGILSRLTSGFVNEDGQTVWYHTAKVEAAVEEAREIVEFGGKVVVFYLWKAEGTALLHAFKAAYGDERVAKIDGSTSQETRIAATAPFDPSRSSDLGLQVLIVQEKVGALGVSFANASHAIFTSYSMDYADHSQAADRIWKPSARICLTYLVVPKSVDLVARKNIAEKGSRSRALLDYSFESLAKGEL